jgi:outer membrane protein assembly factor BamB
MILHAMSRCLPLTLLALVSINPLGPGAIGQQGPPSSAAGAWPMIGHDAQRTGLSASAGPLHPRLTWSYRGAFGAPLIGPDGAVYVWASGGLVALTAAGQRLWTAPLQEFLGGPPALGADGIVRVSGEISGLTGAAMSSQNPHMAIVGLSPGGRPRWMIRALGWATVPQSVPFSKGEAPLVAPSGLLYMPFVGPVYRPSENTGVEMIASSGKPLRRLLSGWAGTIALGRDGSVYLMGADMGRHNEGDAGLAATRPDGSVRWVRAVAGPMSGEVIVGRDGTIYASDGSGLGPGDSGEILAYTPAGRLLWRLGTRGGIAALAQRADGVVVAATATDLSALSPRGARLWRYALGHASAPVNTPPSLAVDAVGRAYVGSGDGAVQAFSPAGVLLWSLHTTDAAHRSGIPLLALGPAGRLAVTGADGVLRLYQ